MTAGRASTRSPSVRVVLHGRGAPASTVQKLLGADSTMELATPATDGTAAATSHDDAATVHCLCLDATVSESIESVAARVPDPCVVVLPSDGDDGSGDSDTDVAAAAIESGVVAVVEADDSLPERLAWVAGATLSAESSRPLRKDVTETVATLGDAACVVDRQWRVRETTEAFDELTESSQGISTGRTLWSVCPPLRSLADRCWQAVRTGERTTFETVLDGSYVEGTVAPLEDGALIRLRDVSDRVAATETVDRYERILETIDDGIYTLDENFQIVEVNEAVTEMTGYDREELVGSHSTMLADESVIVEAGTLIQEILTGARNTGRLDVDLETAGGDSLPVETRFSALHFDDGSHGSVGVIRDIRDRKRYERTLTALNSSAHDLFQAQTQAEVAATVVETATDVLDLTSVVVYLYDEEAGRLQPAARAGEGEPPAVGPGDSVLWESFVSNERLPISAVESLDDWDSLTVTDERGAEAGGLAVPLGEHGLVATMTAGTEQRGQETLTRLLAANAGAALDRVERAVELEQRKEELATRNQQLTHLNQFTELLREVNRVLVEADSREAIERAVCERLADSSSIAFAWVGGYDRTTDTVEPRAWAGTERGYLDYLTDPTTDCPDEPSHVAGRTDDATVVENVASGVQRHSWRRRALDRGFSAVASIPLSYNEFRYGVLNIYATERDAFDDSTRQMFEELGGTTANAISGVEAKESLHTGSVDELDLRVTSPNALLFRLAQAVEGEIELEGSVPRADGSTLHYLSLSHDTDVEALSSLTAVESVRHIVDQEGETFLEVVTPESSLPSQVADLGGGIRRLVADESALDVVVELAPGTDVREFVETLREMYPNTELRAKRRRERAVETRQGIRADLEETLTDRQFEVLRTAYLSGYFSWPRERNGQAIAESLGVAQPTFARHLRVAERKLLDRLLDDG